MFDDAEFGDLKSNGNFCRSLTTLFLRLTNGKKGETVKVLPLRLKRPKPRMEISTLESAMM